MAIYTLSLCGCGNDDYKFRAAEQNANGSTGQRSGNGTRASVAGSGGASHSASLAPTVDGSTLYKDDDHHRVVRGDIFFKLDWIRGMVETGIVPSDMQVGLNDCKKLLASIKRDSATIQMTEIVRLYQEGLDIRKLEGDMRNLGVAVDSLKWTLGSLQFEGDLNSTSHVGRSASRTEDSMRTGEETARQFQNRYHSSPVEVMWRLFKSANPKVLAVGKLLGLSSTTSLEKDPFPEDFFDPDKPENNPFLKEP